MKHRKKLGATTSPVSAQRLALKPVRHGDFFNGTTLCKQESLNYILPCVIVRAARFSEATRLRLLVRSYQTPSEKESSLRDSRRGGAV